MWWDTFVPLLGFLLGFNNVHGCIESHVRCLKSHQWNYRTYRSFHHITTAESCQTACSKYSSRVNYFTFDLSIHRCLCIVNCLIDRGSEAENDVTGTVSDADPSELCQVDETSPPPTIPKLNFSVVVGIEESGQFHAFDLPNSRKVNCTIPIPAPTFKVKFTAIDKQLHACSVSNWNANNAIFCGKFDDEAKTWNHTTHLPIPKQSILHIDILPNGNIILILKTTKVYVYDGNEIKLVSQNFPFFAGSDYADYDCRTPISNDEFVTGMASKRREGNAPDRHLYIINLNTGNVTKVGPIARNVKRAKCGTFGPPENRKVFIFGGLNVDATGINMPFRDAIIFDRNSGEFTYPNVETGQTYRHTTPYEDTFFNNNIQVSSRILTLKYKNTDPNLEFEGVIRGRYAFMSTIPPGVLTCS